MDNILQAEAPFSVGSTGQTPLPHEAHTEDAAPAPVVEEKAVKRMGIVLDPNVDPTSIFPETMFLLQDGSLYGAVQFKINLNWAGNKPTVAGIELTNTKSGVGSLSTEKARAIRSALVELGIPSIRVHANTTLSEAPAGFSYQMADVNEDVN